MTLGPFTTISPIPSSFGFSIFTSKFGNGNPTEPGLFSLSVSAEITGDVSVKPYPCIKSIPKLLYPMMVSLFIGAAPYNTTLKFPPKLSKTCLKNTFLKSILHFNRQFEILDIV